MSVVGPVPTLAPLVLGDEGARLRPEVPGRGPAGVSFGDVFERTIQSASQAGHTSAAMAEAVARGTLDDLHGTMIASKEAEISLKLVGAVRNKLLDAFHELWRTSV